MTEPRYITNQEGKAVEVILDIASYHALLKAQSQDTNLLRDMSLEELEALAKGKLGVEHQTQLNLLIQREKEGLLNSEEIKHLDDMLEQLDRLNLLKARALYTLKVRKEQAGQ